MTISLGRRLPAVSSSRPGSLGRNGPFRVVPGGTNFFLLGLAPDGVCRARPVARPAGELLPHRFTLTCGANPAGGLFSVALSLASRPVGVTHHRTLRSPDFPPARAIRRRTATSTAGRRSPGPLQSSISILCFRKTVGRFLAPIPGKPARTAAFRPFRPILDPRTRQSLPS